MCNIKYLSVYLYYLEREVGTIIPTIACISCKNCVQCWCHAKLKRYKNQKQTMKIQKVFHKVKVNGIIIIFVSPTSWYS